MVHPPAGEVQDGNNFFTPNEREMLERDWLKPFCELDGRRLAPDQGKGGDSQTKQFEEKVLAAFLQQFPYRNPKIAKEGKFPRHLKALACNDQQWKSLGSKIRAWLQKKKPAGSKRHSKATRKSKRSRGQEKDELSDDNEQETTGAADEAEREDVPEVYETSARELTNMEQSLNGLCKEATYPWSQISEQALGRRRDALPADLDDIVQGLSRSTGASIYAVAVYGEGTQVTAVEAVSNRCNAFVKTGDSDGIRDEYTDYVIRHLGQHMFGRRENPVPTVYGDESNSFKPVLPPHMQSHEYNVRMLLLYANALWQWQGGKGEVPWSLLKEDGTGGTYQLIQFKRLPEGYGYMDYPPNMSEQVVEAFYLHILAGQNHALQEERRFQFHQPRPGIVEATLRVSIAEDSDLHYPPESWIYARQQIVVENAGSEMGARPDGLPVVEGQLYQSITQKQVADAARWIQAEDSSLSMLRALISHDEAAPHNLPIEAWPSKGAQCPHIGPDPPAENDAILALRSDNGCLMEAFYNPDHPDHTLWSLNSCLAWTNVQNWVHEPSGTLEGGPYGIKWPVLLLTQIRACHLIFTTKPGPRPSYFGRVATDMSVRELATIERAIEDLTQALSRSTSILQGSFSDRSRGALPDSMPAAISNAVEVSMEDVRVLSAPEPPCEWTALLERIEQTGTVDEEVEASGSRSSAPQKRGASEGEPASKRTRLRSPKSSSQQKGKQKMGTAQSNVQLDRPHPRTRSSTRLMSRPSVSFALGGSDAPSASSDEYSGEDGGEDSDDSPTPKRQR